MRIREITLCKVTETTGVDDILLYFSQGSVCGAAVLVDMLLQCHMEVGQCS